MPVLFRHLPKEELGIWLLLGQSWAALGILDLGFGPTLTRRIAFAKGKSGSDPNASLTDDTLHDIASLVATGRRVYQVLALLAFIVAFGSGFFYLRTLELHSLSLHTVWLAWGVICLSQSIIVLGNIWDCLLQGVGYVGWDAVLGSFINALVLSVQITVVLCGGGLLLLATVAAVGAFFQRFVLRRFARSKRPELFSRVGTPDFAAVRSMASVSLHSWLTSLGSALVLYTDQIIISSLQGVTLVPEYRAAFVIVHNLTIVAVTFGMASGVFVSHLWQAGEISQVHRLLVRNVRLGWIVMLVGAAVLIFAGESLFDVWLGKGHFIGFPILMVFLFSESMEAQSYVIATTSRATEDEPFAVSAILAGVVKLGLSLWLATRFGLLGVALGTAIALLFTNHWFMTYRGLKRLRFTLGEYFSRIIIPCASVFAVSIAIFSVIRLFSQRLSALETLLTYGAGGSVLFTVSCWILILEPGQRSQIRHRLGF